MASLSITRLAMVPILLGPLFAPYAAAESLQELTQTRDRPLFVPSRRPPAPPVVAVAPIPAPIMIEAPAAPPRPTATLTGVIKGPDRDSAILKLASSSKPAITHLGDSIEGWLVAAIGERSIVLTNGDDILELQLTKAKDQSGSVGALNNVPAGLPRSPRSVKR